MSISTRDVQFTLMKAGYYKGVIDGYAGDSTMRGVNVILNTREDMLSRPRDEYSQREQLVAALQIILTFAGYKVGPIDGYVGPVTDGQFDAWSHEVHYGIPLELNRSPIRTDRESTSPFPLQKDCPSFYGTPGPAVRAQLIQINVPFPLKLEWNPSQIVTKVTIHKLCADATMEALTHIEEIYGYQQIEELGLDLFAGAYNHRFMRGGKKWSMHAYGCALDFYAAKNGLTTRAPKALFSHKEYEPWIDAWETAGFISLGREIGRDYMHVQAARLS